MGSVRIAGRLTCTAPISRLVCKACVNGFMTKVRAGPRAGPTAHGPAAIGLAVLIFCGTLCLSTGWAREDAPPVFDLDPLVVEERERADFAGGLETGMTLLELRGSARGQEGTLGEALSWEPGLASSFYGPGASRPIVRGLGGFRVGVFQGGLSTGDLSAESPDHAVAVEPLFLREVVLHRGAAALVFGGGSIGGAVDVEPDYLPVAAMPEAWSGETGLLLSSGDDGRTAYSKSAFRDGLWALQLNALARETDDYRIPGLARTADYDFNNRLRLPPGVQGQVGPNPEGRVPNTWTHTRSLALGTGWLDPRRTLRAGYQYYRTRYGVPLDGHTHGNPFGTPGVTGPSVGDGITIDLNQHRIHGDAALLTDLPWLSRIDFRGVASRFRQEEWEGRFLSNAFSKDSREVISEIPWQGDGWSLINRWALHDSTYTNRNITYAAGRADEDFLKTGSSRAAWAVLGSRAWGPLDLRLGTRTDWQKAERQDRSGFQRDDLAWSGILEGVWRPAIPLRLVAALSRMERLPNAEELYIEAPRGAIGIFQIPDPHLDAELADSLELTASWQGPRLGVSVSLYERRFDGFIFLENQGFEVDGLTAYSRVQRDARFRGGEAELSWIPYQREDRSLVLSGFADWVRAEERETDQPLPRIPPLRLGGICKFNTTAWTASLQVLHAFQQDRVPREVFGTLSYQSPSEAYTLVEFLWEWRMVLFDQPSRLLLRGSNLLDEEARQHTSFLKDVAPLPGRQLHLAWSLEF